MLDAQQASERQHVPVEVLFYHLERQSLEQVLPNLLEKTLERGWRAVVQSGSEERLDALDTALWTYSEESFLPHGRRKDGFVEQQPIYLTASGETPNGAKVRFLVDGAEAPGFEGWVRLIYVFDGRDEEATGRAREEWRKARDAGCAVTYWRQNEAGRWEKKA
jgi:DNA polymerase-3 subunit chi